MKTWKVVFIDRSDGMLHARIVQTASTESTETAARSVSVLGHKVVRVTALTDEEQDATWSGTLAWEDRWPR